MIDCGLALLGIVLAIGIVAEHCEGLTIYTVDHPPFLNDGWLAEVALKGGAVTPLFCASERHNN